MKDDLTRFREQTHNDRITTTYLWGPYDIFLRRLVISRHEGCVHVRIWYEHCYVSPEDLGKPLLWAIMCHS